MTHEARMKAISQKLILAAVFLIPSIVSPGITLDPVNVAKLAVLVVLGFASFAVISPLILRSARRIRILASMLLIVIVIFIPLLFSGADLVTQFYGSYGRNNGILMWFSLLLLTSATYLMSESSFHKRFFRIYILSGLVVTGFGALQYLGWDPVNWQSFYSGTFSTLGNPNFYGAYCGILFTILIVASLGKEKQSKGARFGLEINALRLGILLAFFGAVTSQSLQGLALVAFGACSALALIINRNRKIIGPIQSSYLMFLALSLIAWIFLQLAQPAFVRESISSISQRMSFWIAALNMIRSNPFTGIGFDSYGDWYRRYRSDGLNTLSNSAHNMFLDFGASTGALGLVLICVVSIWITNKASKGVTVSLNSNLSYRKIAFSFGWHAFLLQSLISPSQIGLIALGGLIGAVAASPVKDDVARTSRSTIKILPSYLFLSGLVLGLVLVGPLIKKERDFLTSKEVNDVKRFTEAIYSFPQLPYYFQSGVIILEGAGYWGKASTIAIDGITLFPDNLQLRNAIGEKGLRAIDSTFLKNNQLELKRLDPDK